jgi:hypothetical protein
MLERLANLSYWARLRYERRRKGANVETGLLIGVLILGAYVVGGALLWITLSALERWREGR